MPHKLCNNKCVLFETAKFVIICYRTIKNFLMHTEIFNNEIILYSFYIHLKTYQKKKRWVQIDCFIKKSGKILIVVEGGVISIHFFLLLSMLGKCSLKVSE